MAAAAAAARGRAVCGVCRPPQWAGTRGAPAACVTAPVSPDRPSPPPCPSHPYSGKHCRRQTGPFPPLCLPLDPHPPRSTRRPPAGGRYAGAVGAFLVGVRAVCRPSPPGGSLCLAPPPVWGGACAACGGGRGHPVATGHLPPPIVMWVRRRRGSGYQPAKPADAAGRKFPLLMATPRPWLSRLPMRAPPLPPPEGCFTSDERPGPPPWPPCPPLAPPPSRCRRQLFPPDPLERSAGRPRWHPRLPRAAARGVTCDCRRRRPRPPPPRPPRSQAGRRRGGTIRGANGYLRRVWGGGAAHAPAAAAAASSTPGGLASYGSHGGRDGTRPHPPLAERVHRGCRRHGRRRRRTPPHAEPPARRRGGGNGGAHSRRDGEGGHHRRCSGGGGGGIDARGLTSGVGVGGAAVGRGAWR